MSGVEDTQVGLMLGAGPKTRGMKDQAVSTRSITHAERVKGTAQSSSGGDQLRWESIIFSLAGNWTNAWE